MKAKVIFCILAVVLLTAVLCSCVPQDTAVFTLKYTADEGGTIMGEAEQSVQQGKDGEAVVAIADESYEFVKWSDGVTTAIRQEKSVSKDVAVTATFKKTESATPPTPSSKTYSLKYNFGRADEMPEQITLTENEMEGITLPVLTREHFAFDGWYCNDVQVTDASGKLLVGDEVLLIDSDEMYAKWTANETFTYKILLVYVTRIDAMLYHSDIRVTEKVHVVYTMTDKERELCRLTTSRVKQRLDGMLDGLVNFQVDEYFTTQTIREDSYFLSFGKYRINNLTPQNIAEVANLVGSYDSCIAVTNHGAKYYDSHTSGGSAFAKYAEVRLESFLNSIALLNSTLDEVVDVMKKGEDMLLYGTYLIDSYLETICNTLAQTIELRVNLTDYNSCIAGAGQQYVSRFEASRAYYLHEFELDGEKVGIPYEFWKGNVAKVTYSVTQGEYGDTAYIECNRNGTRVASGEGGIAYEVVFGDSITVTARPFREKEYRFVKWSDGVTTATRTDVVRGDLELVAIFEKID